VIIRAIEIYGRAQLINVFNSTPVVSLSRISRASRRESRECEERARWLKGRKEILVALSARHFDHITRRADEEYARMHGAHH